jgi:hypothetical protein
MAKELLNDAERFLLDHWSECRSLEESMESVRTKYKGLFERIVEGVTGAHKELDASTVRVTQFYTDGAIGFGRKAWPGGDTVWLPGLWIEGLRLEQLSEPESDPPSGSVWIPAKTAKNANLALASARAMIVAKAQAILSTEEFARCGKNDPDEQCMLAFTMPSKRELLLMIADGDGRRFIETIVTQFDSLSRFVPVLDELLSSK